MNSFVKFFHELLHPHCQHCQMLRIQELEQKEIDREVSMTCQSCINLKMELATAHQLTNKLLEKLTEKPEPEEVVQSNVPQRILQPNGGHIAWGVQRAKLERESRIEAERLKHLAENDAAKPDTHTAQTALLKGNVKIQIQNMEKDLGIENGPEAINS
jgi:hypothetical protein